MASSRRYNLDQGPGALAYLAPGLLAALAIFAVIRSAAWPLVHDAPLMHYVAWRLLNGAVPYRDIVDMNLPGTYLIHALVLAMVGPSDAGWRLFELSWATLTGVAITRYCRPAGAPLAMSAGLIYLTLHICFGPDDAGQRDFLIVLPLVLALNCYAALAESRGRPWSLALAGLLIGLTLTLKPYPALLIAALAAIHLWRGRAAPRRAIYEVAALLIAAAVPAALIVLWLAATGGLGPFVAFFGGYLLPFYGGLARMDPLRLVYALIRQGLILSGVALPMLLGLRYADRASPRVRLAIVGLLYGAAHYGVQSKGWGYHLFPFQAFAVIVAILSLSGALRAGGRGQMLARVVLVAWIAIVGARAAVVLGPELTLASYKPLVPLLEQDLRALPREPNETVQVLDSTDGGLHVLLRLGIAQPTRFIYAFHLFHDEDAPAVQGLRHELITGLRERRPRAIVIFLGDEWLPDSDRLRSFPELDALLREDYTLVAERSDGRGDRSYQLYVRRARP